MPGMGAEDGTKTDPSRSVSYTQTPGAADADVPREPAELWRVDLRFFCEARRQALCCWRGSEGGAGPGGGEGDAGFEIEAIFFFVTLSEGFFFFLIAESGESSP